MTGQASVCPHCDGVDDPAASTWCCRARMDAAQTPGCAATERDEAATAAIRAVLSRVTAVAVDNDGTRRFTLDSGEPVALSAGALAQNLEWRARRASPDGEGGVTGAAVALLGHLAQRYAPGSDDVLDARAAEVRRQIRLRADRLPDRPDDPAEIQRRIDDAIARRDERTARVRRLQEAWDGLESVLCDLDQDDPMTRVERRALRPRIKQAGDALCAAQEGETQVPDPGMTVDGDLLGDLVVDALPRWVAAWPTAHRVRDIGLHDHWGVLFTECGKRIDQAAPTRADDGQRRCQPCAAARNPHGDPFDPGTTRPDAPADVVDLDAVTDTDQQDTTTGQKTPR